MSFLFLLIAFLITNKFSETYCDHSEIYSLEQGNFEISMYNSRERRIETFELTIEGENLDSPRRSLPESEPELMHLKNGQLLNSRICPHNYSSDLKNSDNLAVFLYYGGDLSCKIFNARMAGYKGIVLVRIGFSLDPMAMTTNFGENESEFKIYYADPVTGLRLLACASNSGFRCEISETDPYDSNIFLHGVLIAITIGIAVIDMTLRAQAKNEEDSDSEEIDSDQLEDDASDESSESEINSDSDWSSDSDSEEEERPHPITLVNQYYRLYF